MTTAGEGRLAHEFFPHFKSDNPSDGNGILEYFCNDELPYLNDFELINFKVKMDGYEKEALPLSMFIKGIEFWSDGKLMDSIVTDLDQYTLLMEQFSPNNTDKAINQYLDWGQDAIYQTTAVSGSQFKRRQTFEDMTMNWANGRLPAGIIPIGKMLPSLRALDVLAPPSFKRIQFRIFLQDATKMFFDEDGNNRDTHWSFASTPRLAVTSLTDPSLLKEGMKLKPTGFIYPLRDTFIIPRQPFVLDGAGHAEPAVPSQNQIFNIDVKGLNKRFIRNLIFVPTIDKVYTKQVAQGTRHNAANLLWSGRQTPVPLAKLGFSIWINGFAVLNENRVVNPELMANVTLMSVGNATAVGTGVELPGSFLNTMTRASYHCLNPCSTANAFSIRIDGAVHTCRIEISRNCEQNFQDLEATGAINPNSDRGDFEVGNNDEGKINPNAYQGIPTTVSTIKDCWSNSAIKLNVWAEEYKRLVTSGAAGVQSVTMHAT